MFSLFKWQKINFQTSQFNHFAFCRKSMTSSGHDVVKVFFFTCPTDPIWVWVQRIPSFFLYYCKQKFYNHFCKAWGFMLQNQGNMPWCLINIYLMSPLHGSIRRPVSDKWSAVFWLSSVQTSNICSGVASFVNLKCHLYQIWLKILISKLSRNEESVQYNIIL